MGSLSTLPASIAFPAPPTLAGWAVWLSLLGMLAYALYHWRAYQPAMKRIEWGFLVGLLLLTLVANVFILRPFASSARPLPNLPVQPPGSALIVFSAIPWLLSGGLIGPLGAAAVGALAGLLRGTLDTYSLFSIIEFALMGAWFSTNTRQRFRTPVYSLLRQPIVGALLLIPLHALFYIVVALFTQWGVDIPTTARLDFAISNTGIVTLAFGIEMLVGGIVAQIISMSFPAVWGGKQQALQPSPGEKSLESRFQFAVGTFISLLLLTLLIGDWVVAGQAARDMLQDRLTSAGEAAAQSIPFFLETGQNLAVQLAADPRLLEATGDELHSIIGSRIQAVPYFDQFFVLEANSETLLAGYPDDSVTTFKLYPDESMGLILAANGVLTQIYSIPPISADESARVSFLVGIVDKFGSVQRVLIGRTTLKTNPLTLPLIEGIDNMKNLNGAGFLLDESNRIIYHSETIEMAATYNGQRSTEAVFYDDTAADGTRQLVYYQPVTGRPWAVVLTVPAQQAQQLALNIAMPLSLMILVLAVVAMISLRVGLRVVTGSLQSLATEANRIAQGNFDHPLQTEGVDEVGQLRRAFEKMRSSLQARLNEINSLLRVSQGVASSLEMQDAVKPVLDAILATGANSVSVVLSPSILPDTFVELPSRFAVGTVQDIYAHLDDQILALAQSQEKVVLPNLSRSRELELDPSLPQPLSLLAVALRHENRYYGVVWAGFEQPRMFSDSDIRFMTTLAGQAALAVANAHLFLNVEASRRQLKAILNSTPDPVLVTDHRNRLLLTNRAAAIALGQSEDTTSDIGRKTEQVVKIRPLLALLESATTENQSTEITLADKRTYLATASAVMVEGKQIGRVCIMRDVTHFKELDMMKSEFVATVSHDLRSPLTLMRGYATMLEMVGELNEQQQGYVKKIISGVENMSRLVNNLLDLGRIDLGVGLQVENVSVLDIIERVTGALQLQASQKNIQLTVELSKDMPHAIEADQALLHQAVYNLVENAIKYTPNDQRVTIRTETQPGSLTFIVEDSGIGIAADDLPRLFEKFYRGKQREARAQHGSGLGLAIVHSIATNHGGKVWVDSVVGKGSTFYLQIPLTQPKENKRIGP
ncbi:MAG TPA: ATP-binding protein [Anaerolineales bacterium]|nr:ATP-binding protein [Anaerolineales bacterium]HMV94804.1 ATP-binding protein [Anaerolineales bacterium]HMX19412.1 ATP-binding protein [Anaerolineales bacterium]HMX73506.1 ATP-binding protein [Anaerolineales bacterium]HMZ41958.1 ATP-binding protein [Anaerolineales bacterium]